jgi:hypothetical protein
MNSIQAALSRVFLVSEKSEAGGEGCLYACRVCGVKSSKMEFGVDHVFQNHKDKIEELHRFALSLCGPEDKRV